MCAAFEETDGRFCFSHFRIVLNPFASLTKYIIPRCLIMIKINFCLLQQPKVGPKLLGGKIVLYV